MPHGRLARHQPPRSSANLLSVRFIVLVDRARPRRRWCRCTLTADRSVPTPQTRAGGPVLALFHPSGHRFLDLQVAWLVAIVAPLLGLAFAFKTSQQQARRGSSVCPADLSRRRDRKFAAGLADRMQVLVGVIGIIAGFGIFAAQDGSGSPRRSSASWHGSWSRSRILCRAVARVRVPAMAGGPRRLIGFGVSFCCTKTFGSPVLNAIGNAISLTGSTTSQLIGQAQTQLPAAARQLLRGWPLGPVRARTNNPQATLPGSPAQPAADPRPSRSTRACLLVWPQVVVLVAMTVACFALGGGSWGRRPGTLGVRSGVALSLTHLGCARSFAPPGAFA